MFNVTMVPARLRRVALKLQDDDDGETVRLCECTFRVPALTYDLALATTVPIAAHCFDRAGLPLWGVKEVRFTPPEETYEVALHSAPDMPGSRVVLGDATILKIRVWRPKEDDRTLSLEVTTQHALAHGDAADLGDVIAVWVVGETLITCTPIQRDLPLVADTDDDIGRHDARAH